MGLACVGQGADVAQPGHRGRSSRGAGMPGGLGQGPLRGCELAPGLGSGPGRTWGAGTGSLWGWGGSEGLDLPQGFGFT